MSLYNMIHGVNPTAGVLLTLVGIHPKIAMEGGIPRFRDCYGSTDGKEVLIYTRVGGPNRPMYQERIDHLRTSPQYVRDWDDDFDHTFATFAFRPTDDAAAGMLRELHEMGADGCERPERNKLLLADMAAGRDTPDTQAAMVKMKPIAEGFARAMNSGADTISIRDIEGHGVDIVRGGSGASPVEEEVPLADTDDVA